MAIINILLFQCWDRLLIMTSIVDPRTERVKHVNRTMIRHYDDVQTLMQIPLKHSIHQILNDPVHFCQVASRL